MQTIDETELAPTEPDRIELPSGWTRVILAGVEVALILWALCVLTVGLAYWFQSGNQWLAEIGWASVFGFGTDLWAAGLFGSYPIGGIAATLLPAGLTLIAIAIAQLSLQLRKDVDTAALFAFPVSFTLISVIIAASGTSGGLLRLSLGSLLVSFLAVLIQILKRVRCYRKDLDRSLGLVGDYRIDDAFLNWIASWPRNVFRGLELGFHLIIITFLVGLGALIFAIWNGWPRIVEISSLIGANSWEYVFVALTQLLYLPLFVTSSLSWLAGGGFYTATDSYQSAFTVTHQALPAIPILGAVPTTPAQVWPSLWTIFLVFALFSSWRSRRSSKDLRVILPSAAILVLLVDALLVWTSKGAIGPGRLQMVGVPFLSAFALIFLETWGVYALARLLTCTEVVDRIKLWRGQIATGLSDLSLKPKAETTDNEPQIEELVELVEASNPVISTPGEIESTSEE
ncbi:DUF6350 family protein [Boudabousia marimammalium]|uniref:Uncharacterized protein n=1 Tax=Boudabousia marimammalium TaxID=156892 RepID=A0A1Q5PS40_9ACTO|nr:DUF6350 family protein [Boudabousia marimammalium]OKL50353.1 hypothetical protein BM477_02940 [Boudabousia marimammalium]